MLGGGCPRRERERLLTSALSAGPATTESSDGPMSPAAGAGAEKETESGGRDQHPDYL